MARALWREHCGTPSRRLGDQKSGRRDQIPEFWVTERLADAKLKDFTTSGWGSRTPLHLPAGDDT